MNTPFLFVVFNMFYAANVAAIEIEPHHACAEVCVYVLCAYLLTFEALVRR